MAIVHADLKGKFLIWKVCILLFTGIKNQWWKNYFTDDIYNNLLCVIKCGDFVSSTEVVPVVQNKIKQDPECIYVEFNDTITVSNVSSDFKITVEVYNLIVEKKDVGSSKQHHSAKKVCILLLLIIPFFFRKSI